MADQISRRKFLASSAITSVALALSPLPLSAQALPPSRTPGVPVPDGQIDAAIARLDEIVSKIRQDSGVPGIAVAVVHGGETVYAKGFGLRALDKPDAITPDTVFQLASLSKPIGATVVARQVTRGVVSWDSRMKDLLPWFALSDPAITEKLTVGDLYSHRSGLPDHAGDDLEDLGFDRQTILERIRLQPLAPFRTSYAYTNFGLTAAAVGVAEASGMSWEDLTDEALLEPLGMTMSSARFADFMARENRAIPHALEGDGFAARYQRDPDAQSPAGGMSASASDMATWMKMVLADGGDLIAPDALQPAISPQSFSSRPHSPDERASFYGFGFGVGTDPTGRVVLSHSGAFILGAGTHFSLIPSLDLGIVVLTNAAPVGAAEAIGSAFVELALSGDITRDWFGAYNQMFRAFYEPIGHTAGEPFPAAAAPAPGADYCAGRYAHPYFGTIEIAADGEGLALLAGPKPMHFPLHAWDGSIMVFAMDAENAPIGSRSTMTFAGNGAQAETVEIELFVENGPAVFTRI
ncbi:serine hydrolase [Martelella sp. HB161492]|uniref:serine hydrolase n=1 Tax=Martelella sp. HB161492 TaxID=2720726 RepID=UPI001591FBCD|nr:serine hydrolase [Martelella sp. HB161492]